MTESSPPALRILIAGLPPTDVARLQTFVRLRSDRLSREWQVVSSAPVDVYIHDADDVPTIPGHLDHVPQQIGVAQAAAGMADSPTLLQRPLQFESFVDALLAVEQRVASPSARAQPRRQAATAATPDPPPAARGGVAGQRFRLRRWPGANLLQTSRYAVRMASFLSSRALSSDELVKLSGASQADCAEFLDTLSGAGLLRVSEVDPAPAAAATSPAASPTSSPAGTADSARGEASPRPSRTLLASLRAKLGIRQT